MIRQITSLPPVDRHRSFPWWFVAVELALLAAIPVLAFVGYRALLTTNAGDFQGEPGPTDPGWVAFVEPTPVHLLVDVDAAGRSVGAVIVVPAGGPDGGGAVVLVPGTAVLDGEPIAGSVVAGIADRLEFALDQRIAEAAVLDGAAWDRLLGGRAVEVANPDPVPDGAGGILVPVGTVEIDPTDLAAYSTRPPIVSDDPDATEFRRTRLWRVLLDDGAFAATSGSVDADDAIATVGRDLADIQRGVHRVEAVPLDGDEVDVEAFRRLIEELTPLPSSPEGTRTRLRVVDRTGTHELDRWAIALGGAGWEVTQIANASVYTPGPSTVIPTATTDPDVLGALLDLVGGATVSPTGDEPPETLTLVLGDDARLPTGAG